MKFNTALLHQNFDGEKSTGSTIMPIYQVSAFAHETAEKLEKVFHNQPPGSAYSRISNQNHQRILLQNPQIPMLGFTGM